MRPFFSAKNFEKFIEFSRSLLKTVRIRSKNGAKLYSLVRDGVALNRNGDWLPMLTKNTVQMHTVCLRKL